MAILYTNTDGLTFFVKTNKKSYLSSIYKEFKIALLLFNYLNGFLWYVPTQFNTAFDVLSPAYYIGYGYKLLLYIKTVG